MADLQPQIKDYFQVRLQRRKVVSYLQGEVEVANKRPTGSVDGHASEKLVSFYC